MAATVELKKRAAADAASRLRQEMEARDRAEKSAAETADALAKTEAMLAASTDALHKAREETRWSRLSSMTGVADTSGFGMDAEVSELHHDTSSTLTRLQERRRMRSSATGRFDGI